MKQLPFLFLSLFLLTACQQNRFNIKGTTEGLSSGDTLLLVRDINSGFPSDTMIVREGTFSYKGIADSAMLGILYAQKDPEIATTLFIEPGTIEIHLADSILKTRVSGTDANEALQEANYLAYRYGEKMKEVALALSTNPVDSMLVSVVESQLLSLKKDLTKRIKEIAARNADNAFGQLIENNLEEEEE